MLNRLGTEFGRGDIDSRQIWSVELNVCHSEVSNEVIRIQNSAVLAPEEQHVYSFRDLTLRRSGNCRVIRVLTQSRRSVGFSLWCNGSSRFDRRPFPSIAKNRLTYVDIYMYRYLALLELRL